MTPPALPAYLRRTVLLAALVIAGFVSRARADDPLPKPILPDHYNKMAAHSPFAPPTDAPKAQAAATPPPQASAFDKLSATMLMQVDGVYSVTIVDPDSPEHLYLTSSAVDEKSQMKIASVKWDPVSGQEEPTITLSKGTQFGQVRYEPTSGGAAGTGPRPQNPMLPTGFRPNVPPTSVPGLPNPGAPAAANNALRRGPIRAAPAPGPAPGGTGRPVVLPGESRTAAPLRTGPQVKTDDDDDDD